MSDILISETFNLIPRSENQYYAFESYREVLDTNSFIELKKLLCLIILFKKLSLNEQEVLIQPKVMNMNDRMVYFFQHNAGNPDKCRSYMISQVRQSAVGQLVVERRTSRLVSLSQAATFNCVTQGCLLDKSSETKDFN